MNAVLGARIRSLREAKCLTQEQVAEEMGCTRQKYARLEKGLVDISYSNIVAVAKILGVKVEEITSSIRETEYEQPVFRGNDDYEKDDKFKYINKMIDMFYAHRRLYYSVRQDDADE